jgi:hypothetical protein
LKQPLIKKKHEDIKEKDKHKSKLAEQQAKHDATRYKMQERMTELIIKWVDTIHFPYFLAETPKRQPLYH